MESFHQNMKFTENGARQISLPAARAFILHEQQLAGNDLPAGPEGALKVIEKLGYIQVDTISVVERAHHHVFWTRLPGYQPEYLNWLEEKERKVFEYWAHAAAYLPIRNYRYSLIRKTEIAGGDLFWGYEKDPVLERQVLERIRAEGPLMSRDLEKDPELHPREMWTIHPVNRAARELFMAGRLMTTYRRGFQKVFDLAERVLPPTVDTTLPSETEYLSHLIERDLTAHGLMKEREIGYLLKIDRKKLKEILQRQVSSGELIRVQIEGLEKEPYYALPGRLETFLGRNEPHPHLFHILSPFDNLIIQRKRVEELFGFSYTLECYVPAAKRINGYFCLPMLWGDRFVGQIDLKADRKKRELRVQNLLWEPDTQPELFLPAFREKLAAYAAFNGCEVIVGRY